MEAIRDWNEAFDICRERNRPIRVKDTNGVIETIFPSSHSRKEATGKADFVIDPAAVNDEWVAKTTARLKAKGKSDSEIRQRIQNLS